MMPSLSARRAWIEMLISRLHSLLVIVALRKESVDRNGEPMLNFCLPNVALRKESVDRNSVPYRLKVAVPESLSARRAWIEIKRQTYQQGENPGRSPQGERG